MFEFIASADFRSSLERDFAEMQACLRSRAWKGTHVLAGSIVEALLIDYLVATRDPESGGRDPLSLDLAKAVELCEADGLLTERDAALSSVIRSYRNLIHPGRVVRLSEQPPSETTATIAAKLVEIIIEQVERRRREAFGLTAEQLLTKIERDFDAVSLLPHLLSEVDQGQMERLVLEVLPERYMQRHSSAGLHADFDEYLRTDSISRAYRLAFDAAREEVRLRATAKFVRLVREGDGNFIKAYRGAFFRASDYLLVAENQRPLVKQHILATTPYKHDSSSVRLLAEFATFVDPNEVESWADPFVRAIISNDHDRLDSLAARKALITGSARLSIASKRELVARLKYWLKTKLTEDVRGTIAKLLAEIEQP